VIQVRCCCPNLQPNSASERCFRMKIRIKLTTLVVGRQAIWPGKDDGVHRTCALVIHIWL
jgi:hypothetical protein